MACMDKGEWLTWEQIRDKYEKDWPFVENALKHMKKKTLTKECPMTTKTLYLVPRREKVTVVSTPVTVDNTELQ